MLTEVQMSRLEMRFSQLDTDDNGYLERGDFEAIAERICSQLVPEGNLLECNEVRRGYQTLCEQLLGGGHGRICVDEYVAAIEANVLDDRDHYERSIGRVSAALFRSLDNDRNRQLDRSEFARIGEIFEMDQRSTDSFFDGIDQDGDGAITMDEFLGAVWDFFTSDDPGSVGARLFGRRTQAAAAIPVQPGPPHP